jgi:hypothetical protein
MTDMDDDGWATYGMAHGGTMMTHAMIMTHGRNTWQAHMTVHARHLQRGASDSRKGVPAEVSDNDDDATILSRLRRRASA